MHDARPLNMHLDGATRTATIARAEHPVVVAVLPLGAWLEPALALTLIEIALDVTIRTPVSVSSPACAAVRGLIGQRLRDLRCLTGAPIDGPYLPVLAPLLRALTVTSVGKSTSLGLGTLRVGTP
jgi:hypothetical protein